MKFTVYFEFFGRRMKTAVKAKSQEEAKQKIRDRVNFLNIEISDDDPGFINFFNNLINGNK